MRAKLAPGSYTLECLAADGRTATAALTIRSPDDKPELAIELPKR